MRVPLQTGPGTSRSGRGHGLGARAAQHSRQSGQSEPKEPVTEGPRGPAPCRQGPEPAPAAFCGAGLHIHLCWGVLPVPPVSLCS